MKCTICKKEIIKSIDLFIEPICENCFKKNEESIIEQFAKGISENFCESTFTKDNFIKLTEHIKKYT